MNYLSFNEYCKKRFGCKVYKLSIDAGFTCPNRDGTLSHGGCIFCSGGSGRFAVSGEDVEKQLDIAKGLVKHKGAEKFIAYFQAFSNTYAPLEKLKELYYSAIKSDDIVALDIATRPDCIDEEIIKLLSKINKIKPVFVELGFQTANEKTAAFINRCYDNKAYLEAVKMLKSVGVHIVTHLIFGLPDESEEDMLGSVRFIKEAGTDGVKFHMLNILEGSVLAQIYKRKPFELMSLEQYSLIVTKAVNILGEDVVIHRLTGDGDKRILIAPDWVKNKKKCLNTINKSIKKC